MVRRSQIVAGVLGIASITLTHSTPAQAGNYDVAIGMDLVDADDFVATARATSVMPLSAEIIATQMDDGTATIRLAIDEAYAKLHSLTAFDAAKWALGSDAAIYSIRAEVRFDGVPSTSNVGTIGF